MDVKTTEKPLIRGSILHIKNLLRWVISLYHIVLHNEYETDKDRRLPMDTHKQKRTFMSQK